MTRKFAEDDANLDLGAIITSRSRKYSDLNVLFEPKPGSGDLYLSRDAAAVKQSVKNIVLTQFYEEVPPPRTILVDRDLPEQELIADDQHGSLHNSRLGGFVGHHCSSLWSIRKCAGSRHEPAVAEHRSS